MKEKTCEEDFKNILLGRIGKLELQGTEIPSRCWSRSWMNLLKRLLLKSTITKEEVRYAIHQRLMELGKNSYTEHLSGTYANHTRSPHAFAYALMHNGFLPKERQEIHFYGDYKTIQEFIEAHRTETELCETVYNTLCVGSTVTNRKRLVLM